MTAITKSTPVTITTGTTTRTTTTTAPSALEGLLLGRDEINTAIGATGMRVAKI